MKLVLGRKRKKRARVQEAVQHQCGAGGACGVLLFATRNDTLTGLQDEKFEKPQQSILITLYSYRQTYSTKTALWLYIVS